MAGCWRYLAGTTAGRELRVFARVRGDDPRMSRDGAAFRLIIRFLIIALLLVVGPMTGIAQAAPFKLFDGQSVVPIVRDGGRTMTLAAEMLARDVTAISGRAPVLGSTLDDCGNICIVIGPIGSPLIEAAARDSGVNLSDLSGKWEQYVRVEASSRTHPSRRYLLVAGSDPRGAVWGVVDLTRELGVSAWEWWADVAPRPSRLLVVDGARRQSASPSVRYRGIFLNDEDWGLQPWAAKTFEPEVGDIGPKTYGRIFELLWRLKANLIWPAMHESTRPFYQIPGNADVARDYAIVVGTSHAEPMMRNNVREWDEGTQGPFNFFSNRPALVEYWRQRALEVAGYDNIYSVGLRGKHDSEMEGATSPRMAREATTEAIDVQRQLLTQTQHKPANEIPQALTLYKEVLDLYRQGLKIPDDITLVWPDDNYGYMSQLPDAAERARIGGGGIYYHLSYWGRPHDYLWLGTTHPALIREQMDRVRNTGARQLWVVNVGDIKPAEYLTQYFLDLAFDNQVLNLPAKAHLEAWLATQFGGKLAPGMARVMTEYYDLAFERRPEFMGFNQVEPITQVQISPYIASGGQEAVDRIERYARLRVEAEALADQVPANRRDAFFQLVLYPIRASAAINTRNLSLDLAALRTRQGRPVANRLVADAREAHQQIVTDTLAYNRQNHGKWDGIMSMAPRALPVFAEPPYPTADLTAKAGCGVDTSALTFVQGRPARHNLSIYSFGADAQWSLDGFGGLSASRLSGTLNAANGHQQDVALTYDGSAPGRKMSGTVRCGAQNLPVAPGILEALDAETPVNIGNVVSIAAATPSSISEEWERIEGLGSRGASLRARLSIPSRNAHDRAVPLTYTFSIADQSDADMQIVAVPVHPLTSRNGLRIAVALDGGDVHTLDFETHGRSDEWKRNVLSNTAVRHVQVPQLSAGKHTLQVWALDPGFLLDRIDVRLDGAPMLYGARPDR